MTQRLESLLESVKKADLPFFSSQIMKDSAQFTRVMTQKKGPDYRKMHVYTKSLKQYKKERQRRKQVKQLLHDGLTQAQAAQKLGISERTLRRDWAKLKSYELGLWNSKIRQLNEERRQQYEQDVTGKSLKERYNILTNLLIQQMEWEKREYYKRHKFPIIVDMDDMTDGCPRIHPEYKSSWTMPLHFVFKLKRNNQTEEIGGFTIASTNR